MLSRDIGCGFLDILNPEHKADVSLDLNLDKAFPSLIRKLKIPIIGDTQNLPFRNDIFYNIYWNAILENLPDPVKSLLEGKKLLGKTGKPE